MHLSTRISKDSVCGLQYQEGETNDTVVSAGGDIRNCISIDVEGFIESNLESFRIKDKYISKEEANYEIEKNINIILNLLDDMNIKGTFFFLGRIAQDIPGIVKETAYCGHEIGCHSHEHVRVFGLTKDEFRERLIHAKKNLEDVSGSAVYGFRAPEFSITQSCLWALDILKEAEFLYDSSIYPIGLHDVYGVTNAERFIHRLPNDLIEFPLSTFNMFGKRFPFGGGGYFRLYPLVLTKLLIQNMNTRGHPCMLFIHPYEAGTAIPAVSGLSFYRKFRHYFNCKSGNKRLKNILNTFKFTTAIEILRERKYIN